MAVNRGFIKQHRSRHVRFPHHRDDRAENARERPGITGRELRQGIGQLYLGGCRGGLSLQISPAHGKRKLNPSRIDRRSHAFHQTTIDQPAHDDRYRTLVGSCSLRQLRDAHGFACGPEGRENEELGSGQIQSASCPVRAPERMHDPPDRVHELLDDRLFSHRVLAHSFDPVVSKIIVISMEKAKTPFLAGML
jgi:hypothetical protein